jgi:hypothetical protein
MPNKNPNSGDVDIETIAETENYVLWVSHEPDEEIVYHVELGAMTLHFFAEEWEELKTLIQEASQK